MKLINTPILDLWVIEPAVFSDDRGWFMESYSEKRLKDQGIEYTFVQDNHSLSMLKGTLRGLHYQAFPHAQTKLVRCTKGAIYDVVIDLRPYSKTYLKWFGITLNSANKKQLLIPKGFAHGFLALEDDTEVQYKVDEIYHAPSDGSILWNDPSFNIDWPIQSPILSDKDKNAPSYNALDPYTIYPGGEKKT